MGGHPIRSKNSMRIHTGLRLCLKTNLKRVPHTFFCNVCECLASLNKEISGLNPLLLSGGERLASVSMSLVSNVAFGFERKADFMRLSYLRVRRRTGFSSRACRDVTGAY
jgi:hypothetical protein